MARLYSNENVPQPVVVALRERGHDVLSALETGNANQAISDDEVLRFATEEARGVLTINRKHFIRLHRARPDHAGIVVCTLDADFSGQAERIDDALKACSSLEGQLLRVNRPQ